MIHVIEWHSSDSYLVFDEETGQLGNTSSDTIAEAISNFLIDSWDTKSQPKRNMHIKDNILYDRNRKHKVMLSYESLETLSTVYPEYFI